VGEVEVAARATDARVQRLGDALDDAALAGGIAALEQHADPEALQAHPFLHLEQLELQAHQLVDVLVVAGGTLRRPTGSDDAPAAFGRDHLLGITAEFPARLERRGRVCYGAFELLHLDSVTSRSGGGAVARVDWIDIIPRRAQQCASTSRTESVRIE
jgi:hypothetical protein